MITWQSVPAPSVQIESNGRVSFSAVELRVWNAAGLLAFACFVAAGAVLVLSESGWVALAVGLGGVVTLVVRRRAVRVVVVEPAGGPGASARLESRLLGLVLRREVLPPGTRCVVETPDDEGADYGLGVPRLSLRAGDVEVGWFSETASMDLKALEAFAAEVNARLPRSS
ncbi:MAG: hypothetical protein Q8S33_37905 [Myxococcales bacterium]|nr:hypothetical protein [Myxococcales bacterium]